MIKIDDSRWKICLNKGISETDSRFDMPLSILINLSKNIKKVELLRDDGVKENYKRRSASSIILEMLPDENIYVLINKE